MKVKCGLKLKNLENIAQLAEQATTNSTEELSDTLISQGE